MKMAAVAYEDREKCGGEGALSLLLYYISNKVDKLEEEGSAALFSNGIFVVEEGDPIVPRRTHAATQRKPFFVFFFQASG